MGPEDDVKEEEISVDEINVSIGETNTSNSTSSSDTSSAIVQTVSSGETNVSYSDTDIVTTVSIGETSTSNVVVTNTTCIMAKMIEPPSFVSELKTYSEYKADLEMWSRITSLDKSVQAEMVVYRLEGHPSRIKEKIMTQIGDKLKNNNDGIKTLLDFLDGIYNKDDMADAWDKFVEFSSFSRKPEQSMVDFISDWSNCYYKAKKVGCEYSDVILPFKLLRDANLEEMEIKLVLTGVNYAEGKTKEDLLKQVIESLKKFKGRSVMTGKEEHVDVKVKVEPTWMSEMQEVLLAKGWKPPKKGPRRRSRSESPVKTTSSLNYKGRKNKLGANFKPLKCHICKCDHVENCNCPCVYHFQEKCPRKRKGQEDATKGKHFDFGLFVKTNILKEESDDEVVLVMKESLGNLVLLSMDKYEAVVDSACPTTVAGKKWMEDFVAELDEENKARVRVEDSERIFKFGGGEKRKSLGVVKFPCHLAGKNVKMKTEVVDADFPLLLGNTMLKKAGAVLFLSEEKAVIMNSEVRMRETSSGHFSLNVEVPKKDVAFTKLNYDATNDNEDSDDSGMNCLVNEELSLRDVEKLHHQFGHVSNRKLEELIKNSKKLTKEVKGYLEDVTADCKSCKLNKKVQPKPAVGLPRSSKFNQIVTVDLKHYKEKNNRYILYLVDMFSHFTIGVFIPDKKPSTIGAAALEKWIAVFGRMETIHSDHGGEFCCTELADIAEYLGIRSTFTAAYSPNQNGLNERNHAICDRMIDKIRMQDPSLSAELALTWAIVAKNTLQNVTGFSPFQIVFGQMPSLPSVYTAGPPGLEEVVMSKAVADHINALHLAREAYIEGESDRVLKAALKQRIYKRGDDIQQGDWIYYKNNSKWEGPVKVAAKDNKSLYVIRGGKFLTINSDHAQISSFEGEFVKSEKKDVINERELNNDKEAVVYEDVSRIVENAADASSNESVIHQGVPALDSTRDTMIDAAVNNVPTNVADLITVSDVRKNDIIRFKENEETAWVQGKLVSRAGKVGGKYEKWWNVKNSETGHIQAEDLGSKQVIERVQEEVAEEVVSEEESVYVVEIPRYRHHEEACKVAKEKELASWDEYQVYEEVLDEGQVRLGTNWVLTEKVVNGSHTVKARLTIRGDQEETEGVRKDSPTVRKGNIKIFSAVAAKEGWEINTSDVTCAFLQGMEIKREVFVLPPRERRVPGVFWRLLKPVYGLVDAPRGWHLALDDELLKAGCEKCLLDPAMYLYFSINNDEKKLEGIGLTHVDDILHGGSDLFEGSVMATVKSAFKFGLDESKEFRYVGMNMKRVDSGIIIDQDHYVKSLELPSMDVAQGQKMADVLNSEGQTVFRGCVAKVLHVGYQSRPDVCFEAKCLSTKYGKATKSDLKTALKKIQKLQGFPTRIFFPNLGHVGEWSFVGYGDAGVRSMPDKVSSVGGQVILIANSRRKIACVLNWRSKKLVRKVVSSMAGEALAIVATIGEIVYNKALLKQIYGEVIEKVPVIIFTDSKNLYEAVRSSSLVDDAWLIPDVAIIKESLEQGTISCLRRVASEEMLANCLTKLGASSEQLLQVLQTGEYLLPSGLDNV